MIKAKKKQAEENIRKAVNQASSIGKAAVSEGKLFCIARVNVGLDTAAVREAVNAVIAQSSLLIMVFSCEEASNKAVVCAGVPSSKEGIKVVEWLNPALAPLKGKGGGGKNGIAQGQGSDASRVEEAMKIAAKFASIKLQ